jgi:hypothetical protein
MNVKSEIAWGVSTIVTLGLIVAGAGRAPAALIQTVSNDTTVRNAFPASSTDLINGRAPDTNYAAQFEGGPITIATDGGVGAPTTSGPGGAASDVVFDRDHEWFATYTLDTAASPGGYAISRIDTISGHSDARVRQRYTIDYSVVGSPDFIALPNPAPLPGLSAGEFGDLDALSGAHRSKRVSISDDQGGVIATAVDQIRFNFIRPAAADTGSVYREFDVIGTSVPEPASLGVFGAAVGLLARRRRA